MPRFLTHAKQTATLVIAFALGGSAGLAGYRPTPTEALVVRYSSMSAHRTENGGVRLDTALAAIDSANEQLAGSPDDPLVLALRAALLAEIWQLRGTTQDLQRAETGCRNARWAKCDQDRLRRIAAVAFGKEQDK